ncbi:YcaO-like family protein [Actinomadura sp. WMMA1423]|uniref:YcaO-like family protein n=1 Tax=Actinomadura sp. WMMA1423 TaxID=2591108 RepID=UPI00114737C2|nr:YcaO-like family protein [Actinomadura sp. WMMA1423]
MPVLGSSVRSVPAAVTVRRAWPVARGLGVTRCAETTWLDRIGIPVHTATRPNAAAVIVTAGKGGTVEESRAGALMEAIEQAVAEWSPRWAAERGDLRWASPRDIVAEGGPTLFSMCPALGRELDVDREISWVGAEDLISGTRIPVPAELVFHPCPKEWQAGYWGSTTTGLASGNGVDEALLHGLCEVLERDVISFESLRSSSVLVVGELPPGPAAMIKRVRAAGLQAWLRWIPTPLGVCFSCLIADPDLTSPLACNGGYGFHPVAEIAAVRAVSEAAQSRLAFIQGARDDLDETAALVRSLGAKGEERYRSELVAGFASADRTAAFDDIPTSDPARPREMLNRLLDRCRRHGFERVGAYRYPPLASPFEVVRVSVPFAEHFTQGSRRVGPRLGEAAERMARR